MASRQSVVRGGIGAGRELADELIAIGRSSGLDAVGLASTEPFVETRAVLEERRDAGLHGGMQFTYRNPARSTDPARTMVGARTLVVGALRYLRRPVEAPTEGQGRVARYAWSDYYGLLRDRLELLAERLRADGYRAMVLADDNSLVDRAVAVRAGLGWYGKNATLLLPGTGSWCVLGAVLTDADLLSDPVLSDPVLSDPVLSGAAGGERARQPSGCGSCRRCLPACPTGALVAPGVLDARRCLAWLVQAPGIFPRQHREALGDRMYGCDDCQEVCPINRLGERREPPPDPEPHARTTVDVLGLLHASDEEIMAEWGRWYIADRQPRFLRRNALIVLGNTGDPNDPAVVATIEEALGAEDGLVRAHAVWAAARLGLSGMASRLEADTDGGVRAELDAIGQVNARGGTQGQTRGETGANSAIRQEVES